MVYIFCAVVNLRSYDKDGTEVKRNTNNTLGKIIETRKGMNKNIFLKIFRYQKISEILKIEISFIY